MSQRLAAKIAGAGSILTGLAVVFFYSRGILPLTEVYVAKREMGYYLISLGAAIVGIFFLAAAVKGKKTILWVIAGLLIAGIPILFYAVARYPFDYAPTRLAMVGRGLIPAAFLFLGFFALRGFKWVCGVLLAAFSALGIYHAVLAVKLIARGGGAFSSVRAGDIITAAALAVVYSFLAWMSLKSLGRKSRVS